MNDKLYVIEIKDEFCEMKRLKNGNIKCECGFIYENPKIWCSQGCGKQARPVCGII